MLVAENKAVARRWVEEILSVKGFDGLAEVLDKSFTTHSGTESPWSPDIQGLEQAKECFREALRDRPTFRAAIDDTIGEGDKVAVRMTWFEKGKPTHNVIAFYRFSNGKIVDDWFCTRSLGE